MKKTLIRFLCAALSIIMAFAAFPAFAADEVQAGENLKLTVTTDTHVHSLQTVGDLVYDESSLTYTDGMLNKDVFFHATTQGQMNYESVAIFKSMLKEFAASDSNYLLIAGDLTDGLRQSHLDTAAMLKAAEEESGKKIFVTVGNHDCYAESDENHISIDEFKQIYADFGFGDALSTLEGTASYTADLSSDYRLLAIDSCIYGKDDGQFTDELKSWVKEQVSAAEADGKYLVAMMHHSLLPHFYVQPMVKKYKDFAKLLADSGVKYVFTGHIHANDISSAVTPAGNIVYDVQTGSLITSPNAYREVEFAGDEVTFTAKYITSIDCADLPNGFTDVQLQMIESDFAAYAEEFFEAGICRWLNRYVGSAGKLGKTLKLKEGSFAYNALDSLLRNVGRALTMPIYDDGSTPGIADTVEEIAALAGVTVPESDYLMPYQLAARIYGGFFCGKETERTANGELDLFFICLRAALAKAASDIFCPIKAVNALSVEKLSQFNYSNKGIVKTVHALLMTLTDGLSADLSEPEDLDLVLGGYNTTEAYSKTVPVTAANSVIKFITAFIKNF